MPPRKKQAEYKTSTNNNGSIPELMKELWQAAVNLRGLIEPSECKHFVLHLSVSVSDSIDRFDTKNVREYV